jgi:hypothetical protein
MAVAASTPKDRPMIQAVHADFPVSLRAAAGDISAEARMGVPASDWTLDELYVRAEWESKQIGRSEHSSPRYWYFGKAMLLVQKQVVEGGWKAWCVEKRIQPDRWKRGRLLALAFHSPDEVANLTIDAATELARELLGLPRRQTAADAKLRRSLSVMNKSLEKRLDEFAGITNTDGLRPHLAELRRKLAALDHACLTLENRLCHVVPKRRQDRNKAVRQAFQPDKTPAGNS